MSYTEIFGFKRDGNAFGVADIKNAWRGGMAVWTTLEGRYLPTYRPSYVPSYVLDENIEQYCHYKPSRVSSMDDEVAMKEIWNLVNDKRLKECERIALACTFDYVTIKRENLPKLIAAMREFDGKTSLPEQADAIEKLLADDEYIAVGFNQTSVNGDTWANFGGCDEAGDLIPYNILSGDKHWELFDEFGGNL